MSQQELKQLGFHFSNRPNVSLHLTKISAKFRSRLWFLRHLKKAAVARNDLLHNIQVLFDPDSRLLLRRLSSNNQRDSGEGA